MSQKTSWDGVNENMKAATGDIRVQKKTQKENLRRTPDFDQLPEYCKADLLANWISQLHATMNNACQDLLEICCIYNQHHHHHHYRQHSVSVVHLLKSKYQKCSIAFLHIGT